MSPLRPLPARPSLEYERREAKSLLRRLLSSDPDALARSRLRLPANHRATPKEYRLSDAQLVLAREYGFTSWPRLVRYFTDLDRQTRTSPQWESPLAGVQDDHVRSLLAQLRDRRQWAARTVAAFVPRFYGQPVDAILAAAVTEDEARLAVARQFGAPSWALLIERGRRVTEDRSPGTTPWPAVRQAMNAGDLNALRELAERYPSVLDRDGEVGWPLIGPALRLERERGPALMRPIIDWLVAEGLDLGLALNRELCVGMRTSPETVRWLLDRGADPDWVAPNGVSVLEHALVRYWNGAAVDVLAARARRRDEFWIAAGLGDVARMRRFLGRGTRLSAAARVGRPPFDVAGQPPLPLHPDPDNEERLMEILVVATVNGRTDAIRVLAGAGFDVNTLIWDSPVLNVAVGNRWVAVVEALLACGADPDIVGWRPSQSARELVREMCGQYPDDAELARIAAVISARR